MANKQIDKTKLDGLDTVRTLLFKLLQEQLRKPMLHEIVGRDLSQKIFNMDYQYLTPKERIEFDQMIFDIILEYGSILLIGSNSLDERQQGELKQSFMSLKESLFKEHTNPKIKNGELVVITEEMHKYFSHEIEVKEVKYISLGIWVIIGETKQGEEVYTDAKYVSRKIDNETLSA